MIDFTELKRTHKNYRGANGSKIAVIYNNEQYMLKFPSIPSKNKELSYTNSCISEYLGCHIYESMGIPIQETLLGVYRIKDKEKIVVACKDFTSSGIELQDFAALKNEIIDSEMNGYGTELEEILYTFNSQTAMDVNEITERFWDMFIADALIGNWDRHNGNWGFLYNVEADTVSLAPVYDCGSSLYPQVDEDMIKTILSDKNQINHRIYNIPTSAIRIDNRRINYFQFISSLDNHDCNLALKRIEEHLDMEKISGIIENTPFINDLQKQFYFTMLTARKERILDYSYNLLSKNKIQVSDITKDNTKKSVLDKLKSNQEKIVCVSKGDDQVGEKNKKQEEVR